MELKWRDKNGTTGASSKYCMHAVRKRLTYHRNAVGSTTGLGT